MEFKLAVAIVHNGRHEVTWNRESADEYNKALDTLLAYVEEAETQKLTKEEFRSILSEFPPSICEDSGQPEWSQGELDRVWDFIIGKKKYICSIDHDQQIIAELQAEKKAKDEEIKELKEDLEGQRKQRMMWQEEAEKKVDISEEVYKQGFIDGLTAYAWWGKEGQEVGTGGTLLKKAVDEVEKTWNYKPSSQK